MFRKYALPVVALLGVAVGIFAAVRDTYTVPPAQPVAVPPEAPYQTFVAGAGIVQASSENISIGTQIAGVVSILYVDVGSVVKAGDPLFTIDDRAQRAQVAIQTAAVQVAEADLGDAKYEFGIAENLTQRNVMTIEDRDLRRYTVQKAEATVAQARANLLAAQTDLERLTVRAPVDGQVMQLNVHLGEFAQTGALQTPLILFGNIDPVYVRVDVDENEAWRVRSNARVIGYLRGNREVSTALQFVRFEPYVLPKTSLTGDSTERVDTRVLQVIYGFHRGQLPIYVGQQMDIYIEAPAHPVFNETDTRRPWKE
jgi:RND family efflux transporter MFP subunit